MQHFARSCANLLNDSCAPERRPDRSFAHMKITLLSISLLSLIADSLLSQVPANRKPVVAKVVVPAAQSQQPQPAISPIVYSPAVSGVLTMVKGGVPDAVIVTKLEKEGKPYDLTADELVALKQAGASSAVLQAMIAPSKPAMNAEALPKAALTLTIPTPPSPVLPEDVGVYFMKSGAMVMLEPDIVNSRTAGMFQHALTSGIMKARLKGAVEGPRSSLQLSGVNEFIIRVAEGVGITEYQLVKMDLKSSRREFEVMRIGVVTASTGTTPHQVKFKHEKIASRVYKVIVAGLPNGEYGFVPPGAMTQASGGSMGKVYTFGLE